MASSCSYLGCFLGLLVFPTIADNKGRKLTLALTWLTVTIGCFLTIVHMNLSVILTGQLIIGIGLNATLTINYTLLSEQSLGTFREKTSVAVNVAYGIGLIIYIGLVYVFQDWRVCYFCCIFIPVLVLNAQIFMILESPIFLYF